MTIDVLLFASYAESLGTSSLRLDVPAGASVADVLEKVRAVAATSGRALPPRPLVALNQEYADLIDQVQPGDEIAIIPPVSGG